MDAHAAAIAATAVEVLKNTAVEGNSLQVLMYDWRVLATLVTGVITLVGLYIKNQHNKKTIESNEKIKAMEIAAHFDKDRWDEFRKLNCELSTLVVDPQFEHHASQMQAIKAIRLKNKILLLTPSDGDCSLVERYTKSLTICVKAIIAFTKGLEALPEAIEHDNHEKLGSELMLSANTLDLDAKKLVAKYLYEKYAV